MVDSIKGAVTVAATDALLADAVGKKWYTSKTFWVNMIVAVTLIVQIKWGFIIDAETQALALTLINVILRKVTKEPVVF